jgi:hypothetical protein
MRKLSMISIGIVGLLSCKETVQLDPLASANQKMKANAANIGNTYYVDPAGHDDSTGTSMTAAWKTLSKINASTFTPGDRILFKSGGIWNDTLHIKSSGTTEAPIIIDKYGGDARPIINGGGLKNGSNALYLNKVSYFEVNNLELTNTVPAGMSYAATGIRVVGGSASGTAINNISIKNCYVHDVNGAIDGQANYNKSSGGIILDGKIYGALVQSCHVANCSVEGIRTTGDRAMSARSKDIIIDNNLIEYIYGDGIVMSGVTGGSQITHNTVYKACMNTGSQNYAGIWTIGSLNTLVAHNEVYGMTGGGANDGVAFDADGYDTNSVTDGDIFEYNYSHDNNGGFMLFMNQAKNIKVRYNVSFNDIGTTRLKKLFLIEKTTHDSREIYNNVFYITNPAASLLNVMNGVSSGKPYATFSNNIFYTNSTISSLSTQPDNGLRFNNNCLYPSNTFTALNWGTTIRNNNFYTDPEFINPVGGNGLDAAKSYDVSTDSPVRNAGIFIYNNGGKDFSGNALPFGNPDVGAFQHAVIANSGSSLADAYVRNGSYASTNYGGSTDLVIKSDAVSYARKAYAKFDIAMITKPKVSSAKLKMYVAGANTAPLRTIHIYTTNTTSWLENNINWNNAPMDTVLVDKIVVSGIGMQTIDVTGAINRLLTGTDRKASFLFLNTGAPSSTNDMSFSSREAAADKPILELHY